MSLEAWGDEIPGMPDGYITEERADEAFVAGLVAMREHIARHADQYWRDGVGDAVRHVWREPWGEDPGMPQDVADSCWET